MYHHVVFPTIKVSKSALRSVRNRVGRRGAFLAFLSIINFVYGAFLLDPPGRAIPEPYPFMPEKAWGIWWLVTGFSCVTGMFLRRDRVSYGMAALMMTAWGLRYAYLWYLGVPFAWVSMVIWLCFSLTILIVASWPEEIISLPPEAKR